MKRWEVLVWMRDDDGRSVQCVVAEVSSVAAAYAVMGLYRLPGMRYREVGTDMLIIPAVQP